MKTSMRLLAYGIGLVIVFVGAYVIGGLVVPESTVDEWNARVTDSHSTQADTTSQDSPASESEEHR